MIISEMHVQPAAMRRRICGLLTQAQRLFEMIDWDIEEKLAEQGSVSGLPECRMLHDCWRDVRTDGSNLP